MTQENFSVSGLKQRMNTADRTNKLRLKDHVEIICREVVSITGQLLF